jgi:hypothetical protein
MSPHEIEDFLRTSLGIARSQHESASLAFWQICADVSDPDHNKKVEYAAKVKEESQRSLLVALRRLNNYLSHGIVPEDLKVQGHGGGAPHQ